MASLSLNSLPLGFRFRPTDVELVHYYLRLKINGNNDDVCVIREIDVCKWEPWDLPDLSVIKTRDLEWFFFCPLDRKYPNGSRLNRATEAGYWKATGKDRKIKSGANLIGMKKTLVFYTGRAPKGKRTNWVMHEYRATEDDLDGSRPGQTAFVLLKLFKKQDENLEGSNCDETEPSNLSPTVVKPSLEDLQSELELPQVSPSLERQEEKPSRNAESCFADFSDGTTSCTQVLAECHSTNSNVCNVEDQAAEVTGSDVDAQLEANLNLFYDPLLEPLDYNLFSPLHSQMQSELGSSCMLYPNDTAVSDSKGMEFQYGSNESDAYISEFLDSVIKDSEEYSYNLSAGPMNSTIESETTNNMGSVKDSGSCSESDAEVAQEQVLSVHELESEYPNTWEYAAMTSSNFLMETTHKEQTNPSILQNEYAKHYYPLSGFAPVQSSNSFSTYQELGNPKNANGYSDISGTGIRIRSRQIQSQPYTENPVIQGSAPRRLRLQTSVRGQITKTGHNHGRKPIDKEEKTVPEEQNASIQEDSWENIERHQELHAGISQKTIPKSRELVFAYKQVRSIVSKAPLSSRTKIWCYTTMLRVAVVAVVFLMSVFTWRFLKVES